MSDGKVVIDTKLDSTGIEKGTRNIRSEVMKLAQVYKKQGMNMSDAMKRAHKEIEKDSSSSSQKVKNNVEGIAAVAKKCASVLGTLFILDKVKDYTESVTKTGIAYNAMAEQSQVAWTTILGSSSAAVKMMKDIESYAAKTPFSKMGVDEMAKQLTNAGFKGQSLFDQLTKFGNMGSAFGIQEDSLKEMVRQYAQVQQAGVAYTEDLNIMQDRGIPIYKALGEVMGVPVSQVRKLASEGKVTAEVYNKAVDSMSNKTKGAMDSQSKTFNGMISTLKDNLTILAGALSKPLFEKMKSGLESIMPKLETFIQLVGTEGIASAVEQIYPQLQPLVTVLTNIGNVLSSTVIPALVSFGSFILQNIVPITLIIGEIGALVIAFKTMSIIMSVISLVNNVRKSIVMLEGATLAATAAEYGLTAALLACPATWIVLAIASIVAIFIVLWTKCEGFRNFWIRLWDSIKNLADSAVNALKNSFSALGESINKIVGPALLSICESAKKAWTGFKEVIVSLTSKFVELKDATLGAIGSGISSLIEKSKKVWEQLKDSISAIADKFSFLGPLISTISSSLISSFTTARGLALTFVGIVSNIGLRLLGLSGPIGLIASLLITLTTSFFKLSGFSADGITKTFENLADKIGHVGDILVTNLPKFLDAGTKIIVNIADGIIKSIPKLIEVASRIITSITNGITTAIPKLIGIATSLIDSFSNFIVANLPKLIESGVKILNNIVQGITNAIPKFLETVNKVVNSFSEYITNNLPKLIDSGAQMLDKLVQGITTNLPKLLENGVKVVSKVQEGILNALPKILGIGLKILGTILTGIITSLPKILEAGTKIIGALAGGILLVVSKLIEVGLQLIITLIGAILSNLPQILEAGVKLLLAIIQGILQVLPQLLMAGLQIIMALIQAIVTNLPTILMAGIKIIMTLIQGVIQALPQILMAALQIIVTLIGAIITNLPQILMAGVQIIMTLIQGIGSLALQLLELGLKLIVQLVVGIAKGIPMVIQKAIEIGSNFLNNLMTWFSQLPGRVWTWLVNTISKIGAWGSQMYIKATETGQRFVNSLINWFIQLPGRIGTWLSNVLGKIGSWSSQMFYKAVEAGQRFVNGVINWFAQLPGRIWSWLCNAVSKIGAWGSNLFHAGVEAAGQLVRSVVDTVKSIPGKMVDIGKNIVEGVWNGITGAAGWLGDKVSGFFSGIVDMGKSALGIHSPSRVMAKEIGRWIMPGVGVGIDKSMPDLQENLNDKMTTLTKRMKAKVQFETSNFSSGIRAKSGFAVARDSANNVINTTNDNGVVQNITFNEPVESPSETARRIKQAGRDIVFG